MGYSIAVFLATIVGLFCTSNKRRVIRVAGYLFVFLGALFSLVESYRTDTEIENTKRYSVVAGLGFHGGEQLLQGTGLDTDDRLYVLLKDTYSTEGSTAYYKCDKSTEEKFLKGISEFPDFPFTYYALAKCKREKGESDWKDYAKRGLRILEITTSIGGHKKEHDEAKRVLTEWLKQASEIEAPFIY